MIFYFKKFRNEKTFLYFYVLFLLSNLKIISFSRLSKNLKLLKLCNIKKYKNKTKKNPKLIYF